MIEARRRDTLGSTRNATLEAVHHFCFGGYQAMRRENWGALCVLNHTVLEPNSELRPQPLDGVELVSIVRKGVIAHAGSFGGDCRTLAGEVQLISPGFGITHADGNPASQPAEYVEIRIRCDTPRDSPQRKSVRFPGRTDTGRLCLLASGFAEERPALTLQTPARIFGARIPARGVLSYAPMAGRHVYVMSLNGRIAVNGVVIDPLEGAATVDEPLLTIESAKFAEIVLIDVR